MTHVPYKGGTPAMIDLLGGNIQLIFATVSTSLTHVKAGKIRAIAVTSAKRAEQFADLPTIAEAGVPGYEATIWLGLMAPAGTPRPVIEKLNAEIARILGSAEVRDGWGKQGAVPMGMAIDQFDRFLREDIAKWSGVVKATGMKVE
jgi:tripartite-type tricarboxylate transporter receptor subunit TctC